LKFYLHLSPSSKGTKMTETILLGRDKQLVEIPRAIWQKHLDEAPAHMAQRLAFMTAAHHRVRYYVVRELPRTGTVIHPEQIATALQLPLAEVISILDDLEENLTFLYRDEAGSVEWAYPVTVQQTPHTIRFSSGERLYGA
jgi:hypothetical protein